MNNRYSDFIENLSPCVLFFVFRVVFIVSRIKKARAKGRKVCHAKTMMSTQANERPNKTLACAA